MGRFMKRVLIVEAEAQAASGLSPVAGAAFPAAELVHVQCVADALRLIGDQVFELTLVDPHLLDDEGLNVVQALQALQPGAVAVVMTSSGDDDQVFPALRAGAFGYLLKGRPQAELVSALQGMAQGEPALSPAVARRVLRYFADGGVHVQPAAPPRGGEVELNGRETDILQRLAKGFTLPEIGMQLGLSRHTVADYVKQIYRKLNVSSRAEAALEAARRGLVRP
jgi:DNA-binding NarL/FixJ family response regulator